MAQEVCVPQAVAADMDPLPRAAAVMTGVATETVTTAEPLSARNGHRGCELRRRDPPRTEDAHVEQK